MRPVFAILAVALFLTLGAVTAPRAQLKLAPFTDADCMLCHDGSDPHIAGVTPEDLQRSVHPKVACTDCHVSVAELPHPDELPGVPCANCHQEQENEYVSHGLELHGVSEDIPECWDCHGTHAILPPSDPESMASRWNQLETCGDCHGDLNLARDHDLKLKRVVDLFEASVHGQRMAEGDTAVAACSDCHGVQGNPHRILSPGRVQSSINHFNIPHTCGNCHGEIEGEYWSGIHGRRTERGDVHSPVCTDCHGEHGILHVADPRANVSPERVAEATCTPCHSAARLNENYDVALGAQISRVDSYHGLKSSNGDKTVANCASCHDPHSTLPASDPRSRVHPNNLQATCGECHTGITAEMASVPIHGEHRDARWENLVATVYLVLIFLVIGGMVAFVLIDFRRHMRETLKGPQVKRMSQSAIRQHMVLTVSFSVLVITGFALSYSEAGIFRLLFGWEGGAALRGWLHRGAAILFMMGTAWHLVYLRNPEGRSFLRGMLPGLRDVREFGGTMAYNLERSKERPRYGRFTFVEKAEYWALVWGTVVMILTGLLLWFRGPSVVLFNSTVVNVGRVIHLYEAWLAFLAILIWHSYGVVFKPGVFPGNPSWITGNMPAHMYEEEHPDDPDAERVPGTDAAEPSEPGRAAAGGPARRK